MRAFSTSIQAAALAALLCGLMGGVSAQEQELEELRILSPWVVTNSYGPGSGSCCQLTSYGIGETLLEFRGDMRIHPHLIERIENPTPLTWRLVLRTGITFQNGRPFDAPALVDAFDWLMANSALARGQIPEGTTMEVEDPLAVRVTTAEPFPSLPSVLADPASFTMFDVQTVEEHGTALGQLVGSGAYTGPFAIVEMTDDLNVLVRHEGYWQGQPALPGVRVARVPDPVSRVLAVQNGEADIALSLPLSIRPTVEQTPGLYLGLPEVGRTGLVMWFNVEEPPFDEVAVRRALMLGIDYQSLADDAFGGAYDVATGLFQPGFPWALQNQQTDIAEAGRLLDEAGWLPAGDGIRTRDGQRLEIGIAFDEGLADAFSAAAALAAQLRPLGFDVVTRPVTNPYVAMADESFDWDAGMTNQSIATSLGAPEIFLPRFVTAGGDRNPAGYDNSEVRDLIDALALTIEPEERTRMLARLQEVLIEEDPSIFTLVFSKSLSVSGEDYRDFVPDFYDRNVTWQTAPAAAQD